MALFAGDKAGLGDVFYDSVGTRADQMIARWIDERGLKMVKETTFVRGDERLRRSLQQPGMAEAVAQIEVEAAELDRTHAMSLAMIREAGRLTQTDIARALNVTQGAVSQVENRGDVLLSTLRNYLLAAGASDPRIVVSVNGRDVVVDLDAVA